MGLALRPYQSALADAVVSQWDAGRGAVLAQLSTGGGKTVIFSHLIHGHGGAAAAIAHRREIISQISLALAREGVRHRVIAPKKTIRTIQRKHLRELGRSYIDPTSATGVVSAQTITSKSAQTNPQITRWAAQVTLAVFDEGHHYTKTGTWERAVDMLSGGRLLFVTATPERADGKGLGAEASGFAEVMVEGPTTRWLIDNGFLSSYKYFAPESDLDVSGLATNAAGEFSAAKLRERVVESHIVGDTVRHYRQFCAGKKTIIFATDVKTAEEEAAALRAAGISAAALSGETEIGERERELERFEFGDLDVLVNVDLFDEGFDVPHVEAVIMMRPTESLAKYLQMIGRALRVAEGKTHAVVVDCVRNWERHGPPDMPRSWSLAGREGSKRGPREDIPPQTVCTACTQPREAFLKVCPYCGHVETPEDRSAPERVAGDLVELDAEAWAQLWRKQQAAEMTDDEFMEDQRRRHVPEVGRFAHLKRHKEAKRRRAVLRELVAHWVGMHTGRGAEMSDIHRRFFYVFGVDIGTAFTLGTNGTNELIETIQRRFTQ